MNYIYAYMLASLLIVLSNAFIAIAINNDAAARDLKKGKTYAVLAFFFPVIVGIIYGCTRSKMAKIHPKICNNCCSHIDENMTVCPYCSSTHFSKFYNDKSEKLKKSSVVFVVLAVILYIAGVVVGSSAIVPLTESIIDGDSSYLDSVIPGDVNPLSDFAYYDREGNSYTSPDDVIFYAKDGKKYVNMRDENYASFFVNTEDETEKYEGIKCYVDDEGYFVYDEDGSIVIEDNLITAKDSDGNVYYPAEIVVWDSSGEIMN